MQDQQFDASGFDEDIESLATGEGARAADAPTGFTRHPLGDFQGKFEKLLKKNHNDMAIWEFTIVTDVGEAQYPIFGFKPGEAAAAKAKAKAGVDDDLKKIQQKIARTKRLFVDVGLEEPETWAQGDNSVLGRLEELIGRECTLVVRPNKKKPGEVMVFVNAPRDAELGGGAGGPELPDFSAGGPSTPGLDDIPF